MAPILVIRHPICTELRDLTLPHLPGQLALKAGKEVGVPAREWRFHFWFWVLAILGVFVALYTLPELLPR